MAQWRFWLKAWLPTVVVYGLITFLSAQSNLPGPARETWQAFLWFKSAHIMIYASLGAALYWGWFFTGQRLGWWRRCGRTRWQQVLFIIVLLSVAVLATLDEYHQSFTARRTPRLTDIGFDLLGTAMMLGSLARYNSRAASQRDVAQMA